MRGLLFFKQKKYQLISLIESRLPYCKELAIYSINAFSCSKYSNSLSSIQVYRTFFSNLLTKLIADKIFVFHYKIFVLKIKI